MMCKLSLCYLLRNKECGEFSHCVQNTQKITGADKLEINKCEIPSVKMRRFVLLPKIKTKKSLYKLTLLKGKVNFWELPRTCLITRYLLDKNIFIPVLDNKL